MSFHFSLKLYYLRISVLKLGRGCYNHYSLFLFVNNSIVSWIYHHFFISRTYTIFFFYMYMQIIFNVMQYYVNSYPPYLLPVYYNSPMNLLESWCCNFIKWRIKTKKLYSGAKVLQDNNGVVLCWPTFLTGVGATPSWYVSMTSRRAGMLDILPAPLTSEVNVLFHIGTYHTSLHH